MTAHRAGIIAGSLNASFNWAVACWRDKTEHHVENNGDEEQTADVNRITYSLIKRMFDNLPCFHVALWQNMPRSDLALWQNVSSFHMALWQLVAIAAVTVRRPTRLNYTHSSAFTCWITALSGCVSCNRICSSSSDISAPKLGSSLRWMSEWGFKSWEGGRGSPFLHLRISDVSDKYSKTG